jgi:hypothetical protein
VKPGVGIEEEVAVKRNRYPGSPEKTERNHEIWRLHEQGVGIVRLGRRFRISPSRVKQILDSQALKRS